MEYNIPSDLVKHIDFGEDARLKIISGANQLGRAVGGTMGASGLCVIYEDGMGRPNVTKDGVTVAESVVLRDAVENIGATLIKEAARNTVRAAGDGTSASSVLAMSLLNILEANRHKGVRQLKEGLESGLKKVIYELDKMKVDVVGRGLERVAAISANNDEALGQLIGKAFKKVGKNGVVMIEDSPTTETYSEVIDGIQINSKLKSPYFMTDKGREVSELENPYVLIIDSPLHNIRRIKIVLEEIARTGRPLLIVGKVEDAAMKPLMANHLQGNIKVNVIDAPTIRSIRREILEDLAIITGAKVIDESLGDDMDLIKIPHLGTIEKCVTDDSKTVIVTNETSDALKERIKDVKDKLAEETKPYHKRKLEERLGMLTGMVGVIYVGADSDVELKEKKDRVEDAVHATKAALRGGIVAGGGVALKDASKVLDDSDVGEAALKEALMSPFLTILRNAGYLNTEYLQSIGAIELTFADRLAMFFWDKKIPYKFNLMDGWGINAINGEKVNMFDENIVDPLIVIKTALTNAVSVVSTIMSADTVISNMRIESE